MTYDKRDKSFGEVPPLACIIIYFLTAHRKSRQHPNKAAIVIGSPALTRRTCKPEELTSPPQGLQDSKSDGAIQVSFRHSPSTMQLGSVSRDGRSCRTLFGPSSIVPLGVAIVSPIDIVERNTESCKRKLVVKLSLGWLNRPTIGCCRFVRAKEAPLMLYIYVRPSTEMVDQLRHDYQVRFSCDYVISDH